MGRTSHKVIWLQNHWSNFLSDVKALVGLTNPEVDTVALPVQDLNLLLAEQHRSLKEKFAELEKMFPDDKRLITHTEAKIIVVGMNLQRIAQHYVDGINYVESMLRKQLIAAIGKEVTTSDFTNYMTYHGRKIFKEEYAPQLFSYAIRQPDHFPEGTVGIDGQLADGSTTSPIYTLVHHSFASPSDPHAKPMKFPISAATNVAFFGDRYLHSYVSHQFSGQNGSSLSLVARARQFSSYILLVGTITGAGLFEAKQALIIENKDDLKIPLLLETIPSAKEFKDAIESLSPEQQRFAKAFRSMQLASTLFGFVVLQVKPQLEKLLRLPADSLTKEIRLTQDLMELFTKYQIPSDLLSYDGPVGASTPDKVAEVKKNVKAMQDMIEETRQKELEEQKQSNVFAFGKALHNTVTTVTSYTTAASYSTEDKKKSRKKCKSSAIDSKPKTSSQPASTEAPSKDVASKKREGDFDEESEEEGEDYTKIPEILDAKFEKLDEDGALCPTIISPGNVWTKEYLPSLLASPITKHLNHISLETEKNKAFDLIDALSRSGALPFEHASLHVVMGATHCFDKSLTNTVIQDNVNPIEKLERSLLIIATTLHNQPAQELIKLEHVPTVSTYSPLVFEDKPSPVAGLLSDKGKEKEVVK